PARARGADPALADTIGRAGDPTRRIALPEPGQTRPGIEYGRPRLGDGSEVRGDSTLVHRAPDGHLRGQDTVLPDRPRLGDPPRPTTPPPAPDRRALARQANRDMWAALDAQRQPGGPLPLELQLALGRQHPLANATVEHVAAMNATLDAVKREMGRMESALRRVDPEAARELGEAYRAVKEILEREDLWGDSAATMQREINRAFYQYL